MPIDYDKVLELENELTAELTKVIINKKRTEESPIASIVAMSNVLCMLARVMFGSEHAPKAISEAVNRSLEILDKKNKEKTL